MLSDYFSGIDQVSIYAAIAFFLFFLFFIMVTIHTFRLNNHEVDKMKRIPFDEDNNSIN